MPRVNIADMPEAVTGHKWVVDIPVGSGKKQAVYRYELLMNGTARVFKSPEDRTPAYEIIEGRCSCPAAMHGRGCKHVTPISGFLPTSL